MLLTTTDQLRDALRNRAKVVVLTIAEDGKHLDGYGTLIDVTNETVSVLSPSVGVLNFIRENVQVNWVRRD